MNLIDLQESLRGRVREAAQALFGVELEQVAAEVPPRTELGDLAFPVAFELAKRIKHATGVKRAPRVLAEELRTELAATPGVARIEVAGAGYINVFFDRAGFLARFATTQATATPQPSRHVGALVDAASWQSSVADDARPKRIVEHTNINPNKAAHIGHLRNAVLGDTFVRILHAAGERVEVQNYIDNTGVQVADVIVGFLHIEHMTLADVRVLEESLPPEKPFDYFCWDLYARVSSFYRHGDLEAKEDPEQLRLREDVLHALEEGNNPTADLADYVAMRIVRCHLATMNRLGIRYDVLPRESEILHLRFWDQAFARLKAANALRFETEGRNKGCWVMPTDAHTGTDEHEADKIIVRSNGTVTYAGKDIAYQLWKLGQLGLDFHYQQFHTYEDGHIVWITTGNQAHETNANVKHRFGSGQTIYNVIDARQSYTQDVVRRGVAAVAPEVGEEASVHLAYEMVALSPAACRELGIELSHEDEARQFIEMSGRKGIGVKVDDLIDRLEDNALREVEARHPDLSAADKRGVAHHIATGALRYFLLKWTRNSLIAFDFSEALSFEGETGPYCQYAAVRANSIFRKLDFSERAATEGFIREATKGGDQSDHIKQILEGEDGDDLWGLVTLAARLDEVVAQSATAAEPAYLAKYTFQLARAFNLFYHRYRIISEENAPRRHLLVTIADITRRQLTKALTTLGITVPERM